MPDTMRDYMKRAVETTYRVIIKTTAERIVASRSSPIQAYQTLNRKNRTDMNVSGSDGFGIYFLTLYILEPSLKPSKMK